MNIRQDTKIAIMQEQIGYISKQVDIIITKLDNNYVTVEEHESLREITKELQANQSKIVWLVITTVVATIAGIIGIK